jgi:hypothetical protein
MKTRILIKMILLLSLITFFDFVLMILLGIASSNIGLSDSFFCGPYCFIGKGVLFLSAVLFISLLLFELRKIKTHNTNVEAS